MAHGMPDWGHSKQETVYSLVDDLGELAARLGWIGVYDRRGDVIWFDDFNNGLGAWTTDAQGTGGAVDGTIAVCKWPPFAVELKGGSDAGGWARIINYQAPPVVGRDGLELSINFFETFDYFTMLFQMDDTTARKGAGIKVDYTNSLLQYLDTNGAWVDLDDLTGEHVTLNVFATMKLVADFSANEYVHFRINRDSYDLSGIGLRNLATTADARLWSYITFYSRAGYNDRCYIDGVIITQNEP